MQKVNGVEVHEPAVAPAASVTNDAGETCQLPPEFIQKLKAPLPAEAVSPNSDKPGLSSIKVIFVVERLNEVFGLNGWKVVNEVVESGQMVVVKATLSVPKYEITVEQFGGNNNFDRGDAYKGACTDALSKCASYLGVGMDVYKGLHGQARKSGSTNVSATASGAPAEQTMGQRGSAPSATNNATRTKGAEPTGLASKNMMERFVAMKGVLGNQEFNEVLGRHGVRDVAQISSLEKARGIYRVCLDSFRVHYVNAMRQVGRAEYGKILSELRFSPKARLSPEQSIGSSSSCRRHSMQSSNGPNGAAVAELPAPVEIASSLTLFQIEESLTLLAEAAQEEGLTPEIEQAFAQYLEGAAEKRDRVAEFIQYCEGMAELAKSQVKRLQARQKGFEAAERVESMVLRVLDAFGVNRLEGKTHTLKKRKCPASVEVTDETQVPGEFKRVTVTLPLVQWSALLAEAPEQLREQIMKTGLKHEFAVDLTAIKQALNLEQKVSGADLRINRFSLQIS